MADTKSKIQIEVELIKDSVHNIDNWVNSLAKNITNKLGNVRIDLKGTKEAVKSVKEVEKALDELIIRAFSFKTTTANPFSQVFSVKQVEEFKKKVTDLKKTIQETLAEEARKGFEKKTYIEPFNPDVWRTKTVNSLSVALDKFKYFKGEVDKLSKMRSADKESYVKSMFPGLDGEQLKRVTTSYISNIKSGLADVTKELDGHRKGFSSMTNSVIRDTKDLIKWQARWYGAKVLLFKPMELLGQGAKEFIAWQQGMKNVQAVSQTSEENLRKLEEVTLEIGRTTPISAKEAAKAQLEFAQAGVDVDTIQKALPISAKMVVATQEDMKTAVSALTTVYNVWKGDAANMATVGDKLAASMAESKLKVADLSTIFNYLATTSKASNISLNDTLVLITALSQAGVKASTIGTGLSNLISRLTSPTPKFESALGRKGLKFSDISLPENSILKSLKLMKDAGIDVVDLFSGIEMRAGRTATALLSQVDAFDKINDKINEANILNKMFGTSMEGMENQFKRMGNVLMNIFIQIGRDASKDLLSLITVLGNLVDILEMVFGSSESLREKFYNLSESTKVWVEMLGILKDAVGSAVDVLKLGFGVILLEIIKSLKIVGTLLGGVAAGMVSLVSGDFRGVATIAKQVKDDVKSIADETLNKQGAIAEGVVANRAERAKNREARSRMMWNKLRPEDIAEGYIPGVYFPEGGAAASARGDKGKYKARMASDYAGIKKSVDEALKLYKEQEEERLMLLENSQKLSLVSEIEYQKKKIEIAEEYLPLRLAQEEKLWDSITKKGGEVYEQYIKDKAKAEADGDKELVKQIEQRWQNEKDESVRRIKDIKNAEKKIRLDATAEIYLLEQQLALNHYKFLQEQKDKSATFDVENLKKNNSIQAKIYDWLFNRRKITATQYFDAEQERINQEYEVEKQVLEDRYTEFLKEQVREYEAAGENLVKLQKLDQEGTDRLRQQLEEETQLYVNYNEKIVELTIKREESIDDILQKKGVLGVLGKSMEDMAKEFGTLGENLKSTFDGVAKSMAESFQTFFFDVMTGELKTFEDYLKSFLRSVANVLSQVMSNLLMSGITGGLGSLFSPSGGYNLGGGILDSSGGAVNYMPAPRARGGYVGLNKAYLVGEHGAEIFIPRSSGMISPNSSLRGGGTTNVAINVDNKTGEKVTMKQQGEVRWDGKQYIVDVVMEKMSTSLEFRNFMRGR